MCNGIKKIKCTLMKCHTNVNSIPFTQLPHTFSYIVAILGHNHFESPNMVSSLDLCSQGRLTNFCIQCGNFNWNKIHNLDIGNFCKKSRNRSIFCFSLPTFWRIWFLRICSQKFATTPNFFFQMEGYARNTTHYLFPEYFQSLRTKK
jgi:hypothetical protein